MTHDASFANHENTSVQTIHTLSLICRHLSNDSPQVAILDFGSQYSHLIARRVRELHVYCELYSCLVSPEELGKHELTAVILSGGPNSVYDDGAPHVADGVWDIIRERKVPVLGICYGMQARK